MHAYSYNLLMPACTCTCIWSTLFQIEVCLSQVQSSGKELNLLSVYVNGLKAEVNDRNWDLQGSVSIHDLAIYDHITPGPTPPHFIP